jgi:hypothetical protein
MSRELCHRTQNCVADRDYVRPSPTREQDCVGMVHRMRLGSDEVVRYSVTQCEWTTSDAGSECKKVSNFLDAVHGWMWMLC